MQGEALFHVSITKWVYLLCRQSWMLLSSPDSCDFSLLITFQGCRDWNILWANEEFSTLLVFVGHPVARTPAFGVIQRKMECTEIET